MEDKVYTLLDLSEEFGKDKQFIRRRLSKLRLRAINKDTREHINEPLEYDFNTYLQLAKELGISSSKKEEKNETHDDAHETHNDTQEKPKNTDKNQVIEVLERELKHSKNKLQKSEEEKETLMRLLDQQQRLSLQANQKIEMLENDKQEISELEEIKNDKKNKWWHFFKINK